MLLHTRRNIFEMTGRLLCSESKTREITCPIQVRMGRKEDGGWDVCIAGPYNIVRPCLVYSIG